MSGYAAVIAFPRMCVGIRIEHDAVSAIAYLPLGTALRSPDSELAERAVVQIERYRDDPDATFDLPLCATGSRFQRDVWRRR